MKRLLVLCLVFIAFFPVWSFADQKLMPLEEVQKLIDSSPSKTIYAHFNTVLKGTKIESIQIVVRGIVRQPGFEVIVFTSKNQIAAGMSGSPAYVNGKLVGAVAYSLNRFSNEHWGGISSIYSMMEDSEVDDQKHSLAKSFDYDGKVFIPIFLGNESMSRLNFFDDHRFVRTINTGESGSDSSRLDKLTLKPGMPIVVNLVEWTDENGKASAIGASGTITYVDGKGKIFAFGHPFLNSKNVIYSFRTAEVIGIVPSQDSAYNYKLVGQTSSVLGVITRDSSNGIYGTIGAQDELKKLRHFNLEFKNKGIFSHKFEIKVADSIMTPILVQAAFTLIGQEYGAPLLQETSVTQIESRINLEGHQPILWKGLYPSSSSRFGSKILYFSSFNSACEEFFANIYASLFTNNYGLKISDVSVSVNFIQGAGRIYKMGAYKFPNKVIYGQNPVLDVMFVDEHNNMPIAKRVTVKIDWDMVEKPVYLLQTNNKDKVPEKVVLGWLGIQSSKFYLSSLSDEENQRILPKYFLNSDDFLEKLSRSLDITNQNIFARVGLRSRSGLFDEIAARSKDIVPADITANENGWHVVKGGLKERIITLKNGGSVIFFVDLPEAPNGSVFDQHINEIIHFEVVLEK